MQLVTGPAWMSTWRHSRWRASAYTFGPVGRIVLTIGLFAVLWYVRWAGPIALLMYAFVALPLMLRDVWKPVRVPQHEIDPLGIGRVVAVTPPADASPDDIANRSAPSRW